MGKVNWSKYNSNNPRKTGFRRYSASWKENGKLYTMPFARWKWTQHNGDIPDGYIIHHIDRNPLDDDIDNLICVSLSEHGKYHPKPPQTVDRVYGTRPEDFLLL